ncbi:unnamed protein product [Victoria cruziana]
MCTRMRPSLPTPSAPTLKLPLSIGFPLLLSSIVCLIHAHGDSAVHHQAPRVSPSCFQSSRQIPHAVCPSTEHLLANDPLLSHLSSTTSPHNHTTRATMHNGPSRRCPVTSASIPSPQNTPRDLHPCQSFSQLATPLCNLPAPPHTTLSSHRQFFPALCAMPLCQLFFPPEALFTGALPSPAHGGALPVQHHPPTYRRSSSLQPRHHTTLNFSSRQNNFRYCLLPCLNTTGAASSHRHPSPVPTRTASPPACGIPPLAAGSLPHAPIAFSSSLHKAHDQLPLLPGFSPPSNVEPLAELCRFAPSSQVHDGTFQAAAGHLPRHLPLPQTAVLLHNRRSSHDNKALDVLAPPLVAQGEGNCLV